MPVMSDRKTLITMLAFAGDFITWGVGMTFINPTTIMPTFISHYTDLPVLIGLASTIQTGGWLLPQLIVSNLIAHLPRKKPFMIGAALATRPVLWLFALFLLVSNDFSNTTILTTFFVLYTFFTIGDAMASVAWFDILGKSVPPSRRGRVLGSAQIIMGLLALGASQVAEWILAPTRTDIMGIQLPLAKLEFPLNYALCFAIAGAGTLLSLMSNLFIHEVAQPVKEKPLALSDYLPTLWRIVRHDRHFSYVTIVRLLAGLANMALPFYIIFAQHELGFGEEWLGVFIAAQVAGSLVSGVVLGFLSERSGSKAVILAAVFLQGIAPFTALVVFFIGNSLGAGAPWLYAIIFTMIGVGQTSNLLGFINYVLELAPPMERTNYIGVTNTLNGLLLVAPMVGAALIQYISYTGLFAATLIALCASLLLAMRLVEPRHKNLLADF